MVFRDILNCLFYILKNDFVQHDHFFFIDPEREIIEEYFHLGYKYDAIVNLMKNRHNISMNLRTLKRRLAKYNLSKKNNETDEEELKNIIREEMQGSGCLSGYRKMWHVLRMKHHIHVPRSLVARVLKDLDPEASSLRKRKKLKRRQYLSHGPNQCWHIDGKLVCLQNYLSSYVRCALIKVYPNPTHRTGWKNVGQNHIPTAHFSGLERGWEFNLSSALCALSILCLEYEM